MKPTEKRDLIISIVYIIVFLVLGTALIKAMPALTDMLNNIKIYFVH